MHLFGRQTVKLVPWPPVLLLSMAGNKRLRLIQDGSLGKLV